MKITIHIHRTAAWVREQRLATGENVPDKGDVQIDPAALPREVREIIIGPDGYTDVDGLFYHADFVFYTVKDNGRMGAKILVDDPSTTTTQIAEAIMAAFRWIEDKRADYIKERDRRQANEDAAVAAKLDRERALAAAREVLATEFEALKMTITSQAAMIVAMRRQIRELEIGDACDAEHAPANYDDVD